jgi:hypothetical protein
MIISPYRRYESSFENVENSVVEFISGSHIAASKGTHATDSPAWAGWLSWHVAWRCGLDTDLRLSFVQYVVALPLFFRFVVLV